MDTQRETWLSIFRNPKLSELTEETPNYENFIATFLIPDKINQALFLTNLEFLGVGIIELYQGKYEPSKSIYRFGFITHRPLGYPLWFLAAYPDVAEWFTQKVAEDDNIFYQATETSEKYFENKSNFENDKFNSQILRKLISYYLKATNSVLECSLIPTKHDTITGTVLGDSMLPNDMKALLLLNDGEKEVSSNNFNRALELFSKAIEIYPTSKAYYLRGNVYFKKQEYKTAINDFTSAINIDNSYATAYLARGAIRYTILNQKIEGCSDLKMASDLGLKEASELYRKHCI